MAKQGLYSQEGGGTSNYKDRLEGLQEIYQLLDNIFGEKEKLDCKEF